MDRLDYEYLKQLHADRDRSVTAVMTSYWQGRIDEYARQNAIPLEDVALAGAEAR